MGIYAESQFVIPNVTFLGFQTQTITTKAGKQFPTNKITISQVNHYQRNDGSQGESNALSHRDIDKSLIQLAQTIPINSIISIKGVETGNNGFPGSLVKQIKVIQEAQGQPVPQQPPAQQQVPQQQPVQQQQENVQPNAYADDGFDDIPGFD